MGDGIIMTGLNAFTALLWLDGCSHGLVELKQALQEDGRWYNHDWAQRLFSFTALPTLDGCSHGLVELKQALHMDGKAGAPVPRLRVQHQPRQRVVTLQHVSEM